MVSVKELRVAPLGDGALRITLPESVDRRAVLEVMRALSGVTDVVVSEQSVGVYFDPCAPPEDPSAVLEEIARLLPAVANRPLITIQARYNGPDLDRLAEYAELKPNEVIEIHAAVRYTVRVVGFMPGFAYLGDVDSRIAAPRLSTPRTYVPAGAIGVAGRRTGIYPFDSPGGWNIIASAIDFTGFHPEFGAALQLGDQVCFKPV